jgi:DNA-binding NarL/FixJ family response regulator
MQIPGGGVAAARAISTRAPGTDVVMLTAADNEEDVLAAIRAGASGCLPRTMSPKRLAAALRGVLAGEAAIPRRFGRRLLDEIRTHDGHDPALSVRGRRVLLTPREAQVVEFVRGDLSTREIAMRLGISQVTVRRHVSTALRKLDAPDRKSALGLLERTRGSERTG